VQQRRPDRPPVLDGEEDNLAALEARERVREFLLRDLRPDRRAQAGQDLARGERSRGPPAAA
jgi:hypothetical protein